MTENKRRDSNEDTSGKCYKVGEEDHMEMLDAALSKDDEQELKRLLHTALLREFEIWVCYFFEKIGPNKTEEFATKKLETAGFHTSTHQLPLTNAAIKGNIEIINTLLENNACIDQRSDDPRGDTVLHSLARLVPTNGEEKTKIVSAFKHLAKKRDNSTIPAGLLKNKEGVTVLNVATTSGAVDIVQYIIDDQNRRCIPEDNEKTYFEHHDFSLIDDVANKDRCIKENTSNSRGSRACCSTSRLQLRSCIDGYSYSLFEMLFTHGIDKEKAIAILNIKTLKEVIKAKWNNCRWYLVLCAIIHFVVMGVLTRYAVVHSDVVVDGVQRDEEFAYKIFTTIVGFIYCMVATLAILNKLWRPNLLQHLLHNIVFVILLCVFGLCSLLNVVHDSATSVLLVIIVITGWFFMTFFLMPFEYFSFFNEMLKRVFLNIFVPYTILLTLNLVSFSAAMYILINTKENTYSFVDVLFLMFKLMIGLSEFEEIENANFTVLAYLVYIVFVILTFIFLMNALIVAMGATFEYYNADAKYRQLSLEKLSAMLFLDDTIFFLFSKTLLNKKPRKTDYCHCASNKTSDSSRSKTLEKEKKEGTYTLKIPRYEKLESANKLRSSSKEDKGYLQKKTDPSEALLETSVLACHIYSLTNKSGQLLGTITLCKSFEYVPSLKNDATENVIDIETNSQSTIKLENGESILFGLQKVDQDINLRKTEETEAQKHNEENSKKINVADRETKNIPAGGINDTEEQEDRHSDNLTEQAKEKHNEQSKRLVTNAADHSTENQAERQEGPDLDESIKQGEVEKLMEKSKYFETKVVDHGSDNHTEKENIDILETQEEQTSDLKVTQGDVFCADVTPEVKSNDDKEINHEMDNKLYGDNSMQKETKKGTKLPKRQRRKDENRILVKKHRSTTYVHGFLCEHYGITFTSPLSPAERARMPACLKEN